RRMTRSLAPLFTTLPMPFAVRTFLLFMVFACSAQAAGRSILVYGDSLSAAYGISQARGWVALLGERLKRERPDYSVVNASISGETTSGRLTRIKPALERHRPATVILEHGANDGLLSLPAALAKNSLDSMIAQAQKPR